MIGRKIRVGTAPSHRSWRFFARFTVDTHCGKNSDLCSILYDKVWNQSRTFPDTILHKSHFSILLYFFDRKGLICRSVHHDRYPMKKLQGWQITFFSNNNERRVGSDVCQTEISLKLQFRFDSLWVDLIFRVTIYGSRLLQPWWLAR